MAISKYDAERLAGIVAAHKYDVKLNELQAELDREAVAYCHNRLSIESRGWIRSMPEEAKPLLRCMRLQIRLGSSRYACTNGLPKSPLYGEVANLDIGPFEEGKYPPVALAALAYREAKEEHARSVRELVGIFQSFSKIAALEKQWPEVWPLVPVSMKARPSKGALVSMATLNAKFGLPPEEVA